MAKLLVDRNVKEFDGKNAPAKWTLHLAVENKHEAIAKSLLDLGAEVDLKKNDAGKTPLDLAMESENWALVKLRVKCGDNEQYCKRRLYTLTQSSLGLSLPRTDKKAEWLLVPVVKARKKIVGEQHLDTVTSRDLNWAVEAIF
jgi:hypothetical protein